MRFIKPIALSALVLMPLYPIQSQENPEFDIPIVEEAALETNAQLEKIIYNEYRQMLETPYKKSKTLEAIERVDKKYGKCIRRFAEHYDVDETLVKAHTIVETMGRHWKNGKVIKSRAGALGLMQLMPSTARGLGVNPRVLWQNIQGGIKLIRQNIDYYNGNIIPAITAYNAGRTATDRLIGMAESEDFIEYVQFTRSNEVRNYTPRVLAAQRLIEEYRDFGKIGFCLE